MRQLNSLIVSDSSETRTEIGNAHQVKIWNWKHLQPSLCQRCQDAKYRGCQQQKPAGLAEFEGCGANLVELWDLTIDDGAKLQRGDE